MKAMHWVAGLILIAGLYVEYQKDSSFASLDTGSMLIGAGAGALLASFF